MGTSQKPRGPMRQVRRVATLLVCLLVAGVFVSAQGTVYVTKSGTKYRRATCSSLRYSKIPMLLADAIKQYQPCKICKPPIPSASASTPAAQATTRSPKPIPVEFSVESTRCQAITKKGTQCLRKAKP